MVITRLRVTMLLTCAMLVLALVSVIYTARVTVNAVQSFQRERTLTREGDVRTIRTWMTVPYISRVYHVPEDYLYRSLKISQKDTLPLAHMTLHGLATKNKQPDEVVVTTVQNAILRYRRQHHVTPVPAGNSKYMDGRFEGRRSF